MDIGVVRITERRDEDACSSGPHLVHVVGQLRSILGVDVNRHPRFLLREHEPVAVVIVSGIAVIEVRIESRVVGSPGFIPVVDNENLSVWVLGWDKEQDRIVENFSNLRRLFSCQTMRDLDNRLSVSNLVRMDSHVEKVEGDTFARKALDFSLGEIPRISQAMIDLDQSVQSIQI